MMTRTPILCYCPDTIWEKDRHTSKIYSLHRYGGHFHSPHRRPHISFRSSILHGHLCYVYPRPDSEGISRHRSHLSSKWAGARPTAVAERGVATSTLTEGGRSITTMDHRSGTYVSIPLTTYRGVVLDLVIGAEASILEFLGTHRAVVHLYEEFDPHCLQDDFLDANSIFLQRANWTYLHRFHETLRADADTRRRDRLRIAADIQSRLICLIALTSGIPPQAYQYRNLLLDSINPYPRNLFLIESLPVITSATTNLQHKNDREAMWILPEVAAKALLFYLGILRPALDHILSIQLNGRLPPLHSQHMFVRSSPIPSRCTTRRGQSAKSSGSLPADINYTLDSPAINYMLEKYTYQDPNTWNPGRPPLFPVIFTCASLRSILKAVCGESSTLLRGGTIGTSVVNSAGQHTELTSNTHYGILANVIPTGLRMSVDTGKRFVAASKGLQSSLGLSVVPEQWNSLLGKTVLLSKPDSEGLLECARRLVCSRYSLGGENCQHNASTAEALLKDMPYIGGQDSQVQGYIFHHYSFF